MSDTRSTADKLRNIIPDQAAEIELLRAVIQMQSKYADGCMEGAGEPEFSQFSIIASACRKALAQKP
jgi:hypothetical protein